MKKYFTLLLVLLFLYACQSQSRQMATKQDIAIDVSNSSIAEDKFENTAIIENSVDSASNITGGESLNDIRFGKWTDKEWFDNDYFRTLRKYIDACHKGEIENKDLEPYKSVLKGKFVIMQAEPHIAGGMSIDIAFLDMPNKNFHAWIYSEVNKNSKIVCEYTVREFRLIDVESPLTKENILTIVKEHPENKLW